MTDLVERITTIFCLAADVYAREHPANRDSLVERGKSREEIAELIGVTVGSLQVTCSRLGISDFRPEYNGRELSRDLHFPEDILRKLVFEAQVRGMRFGELVGTLITAAMERDLLRQASYTERGRF